MSQNNIFNNHITYSYRFDLIDSRMYMMKGKGSVLIVDPFPTEELLRDVAPITKAIVFLTHEHYDHICGVEWLREKLDVVVYASDVCAERIASERLNRTRSFPLLFLGNKEKYKYAKSLLIEPYTCNADICFDESMILYWENHVLYMKKTPGHSPGSSILLVDNSILFAGDSLLGNGLELKSIGASSIDYEKYVMNYVKKIDPNMMTFPGHGEMNSLGYFIDKI